MAAQKVQYKQIYDIKTEELIRKEFSKSNGIYYLEHTGATLYSQKQIEDVFKDFSKNTYANPHARSTTSKATEDAVDQIRFQILEHFHTSSEEYSVVFTSGATAALKIVGETFNYSGGKLVYLQDNHTSVLGTREYAGEFHTLRDDEAVCCFEKGSERVIDGSGKNSLFIYPAQSNFSGKKYPLEWIEKTHNGYLNDISTSQWYSMLDAASYVSTSDLDLSKHKPDFVCISFYKIFGYPTGLGALLVKNSSVGVLEKRYFGGGTVYMALSTQNKVVRRTAINERFEDGTLPFLSIIALRHGFATMKRLNLSMNLISRHTFSLASYVYKNMKNYKHLNGAHVCILYHDNEFNCSEKQGGIVNFNLLRADGSFIGYSEVMHIMNLFGVQLRTGCFCNPGACQLHLKLTETDIKHQFEQGHVCGDQHDLVDGKPTGSVRISFGYMSTLEEANKFLETIVKCFITPPSQVKTKINGYSKEENLEECIFGKLETIYLYPIKSCGAFSVQNKWELVETGLKYDREWMIVNANNVCMTQKNERRMCLIRPIIDLTVGKLILTCDGFKNVSVPLNMEEEKENTSTQCRSKICMDSVLTWDCGDEVALWLSDVLCTDGIRLLKQCSSNSRSSKKEENSHLSLANKAQYLLVNKQSAQWLLNCVPKDDFNEDIYDLIARFRPNFVVDFKSELLENNCKVFNFNGKLFSFQGKCSRCQMICIDQKTGEKSVEPLRTISKEFNGKINFGIYLKHGSLCDNDFVTIGDIVSGW